MTTLSAEFKVDFAKALLGLWKTIADESASEHAREILTLRKEKPSDAAFEGNETVDADEMDRSSFYFEAAQREIGIAETAIELIPPRWAGQIAELFETPKTANGIPMDRRARRIEVNQHYAELQQRFGPRTDDVIAYSLARAASNGADSLPQGNN